MHSLSQDLLAVIDHGGFSRALVFLHPGMGAKETWGKFPAILCNDLGMTGIVYSRPEYVREGNGIRLPLDFIEREAERLERVLAEYGVRDAAIIGSSDGASIALEHAAQFPGRVRCVVSIAAHVCVDAVMISALERLRAEVTSKPTPQWLVSQFGADAVSTALAWCDTWKILMDSSWSMEDRLNRVVCPVLAMQGTEDRNGTLKQLGAISARIHNCSVSVLDGLGHFPFREEPEKLAALVADYVTKHVKAR
jgi:pimeloyl-ACP methyl ester carboxylesterase